MHYLSYYVVSFWQANVIEVYNSILSSLEDLLNIYNPYFKQMVSEI